MRTTSRVLSLLGSGALLAVASCGTQATGVDSAARPVQDEALTVDGAEGPDAEDAAFHARLLDTSYGIKTAGQALQLEVTSTLAVETEAVVELCATDETQMTRVMVPLGAVPASSIVVLALPVRNLPSPRRALKVAGVLTVLTRLRVPGGSAAIPDPDGPDLISYHPELGGLRLYDEETRRTQFRGGALDNSVAASLPVDVVVAASFAGPTMPLDWRPTFTEEAEPDPDHALLEVQP